MTTPWLARARQLFSRTPHPTARTARSSRPFLERLEERLAPANFEVTSLLDTVDAGDGVLTLREAVAAANADTVADTITFQAGTSGTILLTGGQMQITNPLTITGNGAKATSIDAQMMSRLFDVTATAGNFTLAQITLTNGKTLADNEAGGAVRFLSSGTLTVFQSTLLGNSTMGLNATGGAIHLDSGTANVRESTFSGNTTLGLSAAAGGAIYSASGSINVSQSTLSNNSTAGSTSGGGAIASGSGTVRVSQSTVTNNRAAGSAGGGIAALSSPLTITNSIVAGNTDNGTAPDFLPSPDSTNDPLVVQFSLIGTNTGTTLTASPTTPDGNGNLIGDSAGIDPGLETLGDNGGQTMTHALLATSAALNRGSNALAVDITQAGSPALVNDQRGVGFTRFVGTVDIGAFESIPIVSITASDASAAETVGTASPDDGRFLVTRTGNTTASLVVNYTVSGTATNGSDFSVLSGSVTIAAGESSAEINVLVLNDALTEGNETVIVTLSTDANYVLGATTSATVTIADNEPEVSIAASDPSAAETITSANDGRFLVSRTGDTTAALLINYTVSGTAANGDDYQTLSGSVTIAAGQTSADIDVSVLNDALTEGNETVIVTLSTDANYVLVATSSATVTIADNEPEVSITASDASAAETVGSASPDDGRFTISRTGDATVALVVSYTVSGTATNGSDFSVLSGSVTIAAGQTSAEIDVSVLNDALTEGNETVIVTLSTDANYVLGATTSATVTIADNEPEVSITASDPSAAERVAPGTADQGRFTVTRTGSTTSALTIFYTLSGSATNGIDFAPLPGSVTIAVGAASAVIDISPLFQELSEGDEFVFVTLSANPGYTLTDASEAAVGIADAAPAADRFVVELYRNLLGREPSADEAGNVQGWVGVALGQGVAPVVLGFLESAEYRIRVIQGLYQQYLGRSAESAGLNGWLALLEAGGRAQDVERGIVLSAEYFQRHGTIDAVFAALYQNALGRPIDPSGLLAGQSGQPLDALVDIVLGSREFFGREVDQVYTSFLGRAADSVGREQWIDFLVSGASLEQLLEGILANPGNEYVRRVIA